MATHTVTLHRLLPSNPERVNRAFLDPDAMANLLLPHEFSGRDLELDAREGGGYGMACTHFGTGHNHAFRGTYLELLPNEGICHPFWFDDPNLP